MAEPPGSGAETVTDKTASGIRPDVPTANRGRRREPPIIDLEADAGESAPTAGPRAAAATPAPDPPAADLDAPKAKKPAGGSEPPLELPPRRRRAGGAALALAALIAIAGFAVGAVCIGNAQSSIAALQGRLEQLESGSKAAPTALASVDRRLAAAEAGIAALSGLDKRVGAIESGVAALKAAADEANEAGAKADAARADAAKALAVAIAARAAPGASTVAPAPVDLGPIEDRVGKLEARLSQVEAAVSAPKTEARTTDPKPETPPAGERAARVAAAAQALLRTFDQGAPYAAELAAVEALGVGSDRTTALKPRAETGAATPHALAMQFAALAAAIPAAGGRKPAEQPGFWSRIVFGTGGLIRVRQVGDASRPDPAALLAQISMALDRGDLDAAIDLWGRLPDAEQKATQPWADAVRARAAAGRAVRGILSDALATLGKS